MKKLTKRQWGRLRQALYVAGSAGLKYAGIKGWIEDDESQALLVVVSALLDLAFFNIELGGSGETPNELDTGGDVSLKVDGE